MGNLLCLLLGIAIPSLLLALVVRRALRPLAAAQAYRQVAARFGLPVDTRGLSVSGHLEGRRLWVGQVFDADGRPSVRGVLHLRRPLGVGLSIRRRGRRARWLRRRPQTGVLIEDARIDRSYEIAAGDPERVRALLDDVARAALHGLTHSWPDLEVSDHWIRVDLRRAETSEERLTSLIDGMATLATALEAAREALPCPPDLEAALPALAALGERYGLVLVPWLPAVEGTLEGREVRICLPRAHDGTVVDVRVAFLPHADTGLRLEPQTAADDFWSVGQDIELGDAEADRAFVVKGYDPGEIRSILDRHVRAELITLATRGQLSLDDRGCEVLDAPADEATVADILERVTRIARAIGW